MASPKDTVVGIWSGRVNQGTFVGSAFFISPRLLLTAKHNFFATDGRPLTELYVGPVDGGPIEIAIKPGDVIFDPDKDVAVVHIDRPIGEKQAWCSLLINLPNAESKSIVCCGINQFNRERDETSAYKVGTFDAGADGYCFDQSVKPGFSGGPAALAGRSEAIGIVLQRRVSEQESLFIPLQRCRLLLEQVHRQFPDAGLAAYFNLASRPIDRRREREQINQYILDLAMFIGRPEDAYRHVFHEIKQAKATVRACLCLYTSWEDDLPDEFARSLAIRLFGDTADLNGKLLETLEKNQWDLNLGLCNPWDCDSKEQFFTECLKEIGAKLNVTVDWQAGDREAADTQIRQILNRLRNRPTPLVLLSEKSNRPAEPGWFGASRLIRRIDERFDWINEFNTQWRNRLRDEDGDMGLMQPLLLLFCIQVGEKLAAGAQKRCFCLSKIYSKEFRAWIDGVHNLLIDSNLFDKNRVFEQIQAMKKGKFKQVYASNSSDFALTYQEFNQQTEAQLDQTGNAT